MSRKQKPNQSEIKLEIKRFKIATAVLLGIFLVMVPHPYLYSFIRSIQQNSEAKSAVASAYTQSRDRFSKFHEYKDILKSSQMIDGEVGSTKVSVCYFYTGGGIDFSQDYSQSCYLRQTAGYYTKYDMKTVHEKLQATLVDLKPTHDKSETNEWSVRECSLRNSDILTSFRYVAKYSKPSGIDEYGHVEDEACGRPSKIQSLSVPGYSPIFDKEFSIKVKSDINVSHIDTSRDQIWIEYDVKYYEEHLACVPNIESLFIFCKSVREKPIQ